MLTISQATSLRNLAASFPDRLRASVAPDAPLGGYSRLFLHANEGFGYYPRFKDWDDVTPRVAKFRSAVKTVEGKWHDFLSWWADASKESARAAKLSADFARIGDSDLYDMLLQVMLNTAASWGDRVMWNAFNVMSEIAPCVARWSKGAPGSPWCVDACYLRNGRVVSAASGNVSHGELPGAGDPYASLFWEYLYPLFQRERYDPPQDPTKEFSGKVTQMVLPLVSRSSALLLGWVVASIAEGTDDGAILVACSKPVFTTAVAGMTAEVEAILRSG